MESFEGIFAEQYDTIHRLETNKLRNVARLFAHLLYTDSVPWSVSQSLWLIFYVITDPPLLHSTTLFPQNKYFTTYFFTDSLLGVMAR